MVIGDDAMPAPSAALNVMASLAWIRLGTRVTARAAFGNFGGG